MSLTSESNLNIESKSIHFRIDGICDDVKTNALTNIPILIIEQLNLPIHTGVIIDAL